VDLVKVCRSR
jgi:thiol-disulfide isomerase/thioredoxin